ncbi:MAG: YkgJ family cysteine cluster protein [Lentisphaeria bacterium]
MEIAMEMDHAELFPCRPGCGACCIAPSISSAIPGMTGGKPAGVPCIHLDAEFRCGLFGSPERPRVCGSLAAEPEMCGSSREEALAYLARLEAETRPGEPL